MHVIIELKHRDLRDHDRARIEDAIRRNARIPASASFTEAPLNTARGDSWCTFQVRDGFGALLFTAGPRNTTLWVGLYDTGSAQANGSRMLTASEAALSEVKRAFSSGQFLSMMKPSLAEPARMRINQLEVPFLGRENRLRDELRSRWVKGNLGHLAVSVVALVGASLAVTDSDRARLLIPSVGALAQVVSHLGLALVNRKALQWET